MGPTLRDIVPALVYRHQRCGQSLRVLEFTLSFVITRSFSTSTRLHLVPSACAGSMLAAAEPVRHDLAGAVDHPQ
jgi:hypothetical protein